MIFNSHDLPESLNDIGRKVIWFPLYDSRPITPPSLYPESVRSSSSSVLFLGRWRWVLDKSWSHDDPTYRTSPLSVLLLSCTRPEGSSIGGVMTVEERFFKGSLPCRTIYPTCVSVTTVLGLEKGPAGTTSPRDGYRVPTKLRVRPWVCRQRTLTSHH